MQTLGLRVWFPHSDQTSVSMIALLSSHTKHPSPFWHSGKSFIVFTLQVNISFSQKNLCFWSANFPKETGDYFLFKKHVSFSFFFFRKSLNPRQSCNPRLHLLKGQMASERKETIHKSFLFSFFSCFKQTITMK